MNQSVLSILIHAKDLATGTLQKVSGSIENISNTAKNLGSSVMPTVKNSFNKSVDLMKNAVTIGTLGIVGGLGLLVTKTIQAGSSFEKMGTSLYTAMGKNKEETDKAMKTITEFSTKTPYQLDEVMGSFIKLKNLGLDPSQKALTSYGDTASSMGKSLNDMIEAVADASTGEFERLKEFGIRASKQGDQIKFTFKGIETSVKNDSKSIEKYLIKLGETNFSGGMEAQSKTFSGTLSTLLDNINVKLAEFFEKSGAGKYITNLMTKVSDAINQINFQEIENQLRPTFEFLISNFEFVKNNSDKLKDAIPPLALAILTLLVPALWALVAPVLSVVAPFLVLSLLFAGLYLLYIQNKEKIDELAKVIYEFLKPSIEELWQNLIKLWNSLQELWKVLSPILIPLFQFLGYVITVVLIGAIKYLIFWINHWVWVSTEAVKQIKNIFSGIVTFFKSLPETAGNAVKAVLNWQIDQINSKIQLLNKVLEMVRRTGVNIPNVPTIPRFSRGGIMTYSGQAIVGENGAELVNLPAGSRVTNASKTSQELGKKDINVTVNININNDLRDEKTVKDWAYSVKDTLVRVLKTT